MFEAFFQSSNPKSAMKWNQKTGYGWNRSKGVSFHCKSICFVVILLFKSVFTLCFGLFRVSFPFTEQRTERKRCTGKNQPIWSLISTNFIVCLQHVQLLTRSSCFYPAETSPFLPFLSHSHHHSTLTDTNFDFLFFWEMKPSSADPAKLQLQQQLQVIDR